MTTPSKTKVATEDFVYKTVYRIVGDSESRINKKFDKVEELAEKRFDKMMNQLDSIAGLVKKFNEEETMQSGMIAIHSDQIRKLQNAVFVNA
ncbi:MAG: hypothetical protein AAB778_01670 [Patescibacteria group bacterium]